MKPIRFFKFRSLVVSSTLLLTVLFVIVISSLVAYSYKGQKELYENQFQGLGTVLHSQLQTNVGLVQQASQAVANKQPSTTDVFQSLKKDLFAMTGKDQNITNAYLLSPTKVEHNGKKFLLYLQSDGDEPTSMPGAEYELPAFFESAVDESLQKSFAITKPYTDNLGTWVTYVSPLKDDKGQTIAIFGIDFEYDSIQKKMSSMLWSNITAGAVFVLISIVLVAIAMRYALRSLIRLAEVSKLAAQGDLTVTIPVTSGNEIGQAAEAFNAMVASLRELARSIQKISLEVSDEAKTMQESAQQTALATNEVTEAIGQVASDSETQLQSSQECQRAMSEMAVGIQRIAESSSVVSELAVDTTSRAAEGEVVMMNSLSQMQTIESNLSESAATMQELEALSEQIGGILTLIADVANQTNLLALNASIEAARAGEHGRGFAVVAQEIRKLAEQSKNSSEQIGEILEGIGRRTGQAVASLERSSQEARVGTEIAHKAGDSFRAIVQSIREVSAQVQEVSASSEQMSAGSEQIAASLHELETITSSSAHQSQRVAASSEEQLASMEEIAASSEQLLIMASYLKEAISRFRV